MKAFRQFLVTMIMGLVVTACATALTKDINVEAESNPRMDISKYKTYAWLGSAQVVYDPEGQWEPPQFDADAELKWLIERELRNRGMLAVSNHPELAVAFIAGIDMAALELKEDPKKDIRMLQRTPKGALVVLFIDVKTGAPVWAGSATGEMDPEFWTAA